VLFRIYRERAAPLPSVPITKAESAAFQTAWERIESEYASILSLSQRANARLAVVVIPQGQPWPPPVDFYPQERLAAWTSAHDVLLIDTTEALQAAAASGVVVYYAQDGHCTPAGYDVVARTIATELTRRGPLAPASAPVDQP
jgi:hypothetical protein